MFSSLDSRTNVELYTVLSLQHLSLVCHVIQINDSTSNVCVIRPGTNQPKISLFH